MKRIAVLLILAVASCTTAPAAGPRHPWTTNGVGTEVVYAITIEALAHKVRGTLTWTYAGLDEGIITVRESFETGGKREDRTYAETLPRRVGETQLTVGGRDYDCTVWISQGTRDKESVEHTKWFRDGEDLPLKWITRTDGEMDSELIAAGRETLSLLDREFDCVKLEGWVAMEGDRMMATTWLCSHVPGQVVKSVLLPPDGNSRMTFQLSSITPPLRK